MTLRRSLAVTAVTALASSAALFAAPAAFADETTTSAPTATSTATKTPDSKATESKAPESKAPESKTPESKAPESKAPEVQPPAEDDGSAEEYDLGDEIGDGPKVSLSGLPGRFVAGGAAKQFTATITNTLGKDVVSAPFIGIENDKDNLEAKHVVLEFQHPKTKQWQKINLVLEVVPEDPSDRGLVGWFGSVDAAGAPTEDAFFLLKKGESLNIPMRISFTKDAPLGGGTALIAGLSVDRGDEMYFSFRGGYTFTVTAPGAAKPAPPKYQPKPKNPKPAKPGQQLANTGGDDSSATTIAVVGGVALVGGAGLLVVMRRRKSGGAAAA